MDETTEIGGNRLAVLAADIRAAHSGLTDAAARAIGAGHALIEAKGLLQHGRWLPWLKQHCRMSERTAQLYMRLAKLNMPPELVARLGLTASAKAVTPEEFAGPAMATRMQRAMQQQPGLDSYDDATQRQWLLFCLFGIAHEHIDWLMRQQFASPDAWLGAEGAAYRRRFGMKELSETFMQRWRAFQQDHRNTPRADIEAALASKSATAIADLVA